MLNLFSLKLAASRGSAGRITGCKPVSNKTCKTFRNLTPKLSASLREAPPPLPLLGEYKTRFIYVKYVCIVSDVTNHTANVYNVTAASPFREKRIKLNLNSTIHTSFLEICRTGTLAGVKWRGEGVASQPHPYCADSSCRCRFGGTGPTLFSYE